MVLPLQIFNLDAFVNHGALLPMCTLFMAFGLCAIPFTYCLGYLFSSHTRAQVLVVVLNLLPFGMVLTILSTILNFVSESAVPPPPPSKRANKEKRTHRRSMSPV